MHYCVQPVDCNLGDIFTKLVTLQRSGRRQHGLDGEIPRSGVEHSVAGLDLLRFVCFD